MALSSKQEQFITWLIDPRSSDEKGTQAGFAKRLGVDPTTLTKWKKDAGFRAEWEKRHSEFAGGIHRVQALYERLYQTALKGDRLAIMNYMELVGRYAPSKTLEIKDPRLANRDDTDLLQEIQKVQLKVLKGGKLNEDGTITKRRGRPPRAS